MLYPLSYEGGEFEGSRAKTPAMSASAAMPASADVVIVGAAPPDVCSPGRG